MTTINSELRIRLIDDVTARGASVAAALEKVEREAASLKAALAKSDLTDRMQASLTKLGASAKHVDDLSTSWKRYAAERGIAADTDGTCTAQMIAHAKEWERTALATTRVVMAGQTAEAAKRLKVAEDAATAEKRLAEQATRDAEREARERIAIRERETREMEREALRQARVAHQEAEQQREAISRGGFGHFVATGAAAAVSAHGVIRGAESAIDKGAELQHVRIGMEQAGIDAATRKAIEDQALQLSARYGNVSQVAIMDLAKEARSVLKDTKEVAPTTAILAQAKSVLDANDRSGGSSEGLGMLVKGAESIGAAQDPERLAKLVDGYVKAIQVMGKTINPEQIYQFDKYLKAEGARVSDRFLMTTGLSLAQEMGGSTAGKDIAQTAKDIIGGFQNKHVPLKEMARIGMIDRGDIDWVGSRNGKLEAKGIKAGHKGIHGADVAASDLDLWVYKYLLPQMEKKGIKEQQKQLDFVSKVFTGTEADVISKLITQRTSFENHALLYGQAKGLAGSDLNRQLATAGLDAFTRALGNLQANATSPIMGAAGRALYTLSDGINYLAIKAKDHPVAAATAAGVATAGGLGASGYLAYKMLNGFGLKTAATNLTGAALKLDAAAAKLSGAATVGASGVSSKTAGELAGLSTFKITTATILASSLINNMPEVKRDEKGQPYIVPPVDTSKFDGWWKNTMPTWFGGASPGDGTPPIAGKRASGGPVSRGKTYLVGEHGPELFTAGMNGAISTTDVQRLLSRASPYPAEGGGDGATARAVRALGFELAGSVDGVARALDRMDAHRVTVSDEFRGDTPFYAAEGGDGHPRSFGGGGRRGFMEGGHGSEGTGRKGFAHRAAAGPGADIPTDGDSVAVATALLKRREGFQPTAKWDRNHLRLGYGSDTITDAGGGVREVKAGDQVTRADAERDLARRIPEFQRRVAREVGVEGWKKLSPITQGALTSMAYNYGGFSKLPSMRAAIASGDNAKIAAAIRLRAGDNGGINGARREEEASLVERGGDRATPPAARGAGQSIAEGGSTAALRTDDGRAVTLGAGQSSPGHIRGKLALDGHAYDFGSGGHRGASSIPFGDYEITPDAVGAWGKAHGALGIAKGQIYDKALGRVRAGIELHAAHSANMISSGCLAFAQDQFGEVKAHVLKMVREKGHAYLHVGNGGASITASKDAPSAATPQDDPLGLRRSREAKASDDAGAGAKDLHAGVAGLHGKTVKPDVDVSSFHEAEAAVDRLHGKIERLHAASAKYRNAGGGATHVAGLGSKLRGGFMHSGSQIG